MKIKLKRAEPDPREVFQITLPVCRSCVLGRGTECHVADCTFFLRDRGEPIIHALGAPGAESLRDELLAYVRRIP